MGSGAHCPGLPTVDYSTTSPGGFPLRIKSITGSLAFVGESWDRCAVLWTCTLACAGGEGGEGVDVGAGVLGRGWRGWGA